MYATTYLREIREMSFYAQASTFQELEEAYYAAMCLVLATSANIYRESPSCFAVLQLEKLAFLPSKAVLRTSASWDTRRNRWVYLMEGQKKKKNVTNRVHILL